MLCFLKRVLPFTLTLILGTALGGFFNLFSSSPQPKTQTAELRAVGDYGRGGGGCRYRYRSYTESNTSARILSQAQPLYTPLARRNQTEGDVILRVTLKSDWSIGDVEVIKSLPDGLTEQAIKAARMMKFEPATRNGSPIDEIRTITYSFTLD